MPSLVSWLTRPFSSVPMPKAAPFKEMGVSGTPVYAGYVISAEKSHKLIGQEKFRTYSEMLSNVSIIAAGVRYFLNIIAKPTWSAEAPEDSGDQGQEYVDFVNEVLLEDLNTPWSRVVRRAGTYRFHGFNVQEWTAKKRDDGKIGFDDIESRPQWTIWRWELDERGTVTGCWQRDPVTGRELGLPRGKIMYLVDDTLSDSPDGIGLLRHCFEPVQRLEEYQKQESYGFLRDLQGVPMGRAPIDDLKVAVASGQISQADADNALQTLKDFVSLERKSHDTGLVLNSTPYTNVSEGGISYTGTYKWGLELISGSAPGLPAINQAIVRVTTEIARILGTEHLLLGADAEGSYALAKEKARDLYLLANSVLRDIREQAQHDLLWPLWNLNGFPDEMMPELKTEDVSPKDVEQISRVLRDMATAGIPVQPDDEAQNTIRDLLGLPHVDLEKIGQQMQQQAALQAQSQQQQLDSTNPFSADMKEVSQQGNAPPMMNGKGTTNGFAKLWDESKHPRDRGRFASKPGAGASPKQNGKGNTPTNEEWQQFVQDEMDKLKDKPKASKQQKTTVWGKIKSAMKSYSDFQDSRPVLSFLIDTLGTLIIVTAIAGIMGHYHLKGAGRRKWEEQQREQARQRNQRAWEDYRSGRGGERATGTTHEHPAEAAVRARHGARAAGVMALYLRPGTPGEKAAAEAALKRMGINPADFTKGLLKAAKNPFDAIDHLLTKDQADQLLQAIMDNLTADQAQQLIDKDWTKPNSSILDDEEDSVVAKASDATDQGDEVTGNTGQDMIKLFGAMLVALDKMKLSDHPMPPDPTGPDGKPLDELDPEYAAKANWEEDKHPRDKGRFASKPGAGAAPEQDQQQQKPGRNRTVEQHATTMHDITKFISKQASNIGSWVKEFLTDNALSIAATTVISIGITRMMTNFIGGILGGPAGTIAINVIYEGVSQMVEATKIHAGVSDRDAWGLLHKVTSGLYDQAKSTFSGSEEVQKEFRGNGRFEQAEAQDPSA